jgi:hypothetical protein
MIYKRPVFSLFTEQKQEIESSGDFIQKAIRSGKLLASGEAGYYDIQSQSHEIERVYQKNVSITKPKGKGIDHHYPNPPQLASTDPTAFRQNAEYWGIPQNGSQTKAFYQSGIYVAPNDSATGITAKCLDYYYKSEIPNLTCPSSNHSGIFHFDEGSGKFSNGFNTVKNPALDSRYYYLHDCLPKPWGFSVSKPLYLSREMYMIHKGTGSLPVTIPYLGDYEKFQATNTLNRYPEDSVEEFKSDVEKFLEGQDVQHIKEEGYGNSAEGEDSNDN